MRKVTKGNVTIKLWDIGGQPRFRSMWERYCRGVNAIVYMVDAAAPDKMESAKQELHALLAKEQLASIPVRNWGRCRCPLCPSLQRARSRCSAPAVNVNVGAHRWRGTEGEREKREPSRATSRRHTGLARILKIRLGIHALAVCCRCWCSATRTTCRRPWRWRH